jgi:FkbM family methyltransferase
MEETYYSQNGEDALLWRIFQNQKDGIFVDIGARDGLALSNTLLFEQKGWRGLCAEAHPTYAKACMVNRKAIVVHAAIADEDKDTVPFYITNMGCLSTLDKEMESYFKAAYRKHFTGWQVIDVPMRTVNTMLEHCPFDHVDFISIDVEGSELNVLRGFDLKKYNPRIILSEAIQKHNEVELSQYLTPQGYFFARKLGNNLFFCANKQDIEILQK